MSMEYEHSFIKVNDINYVFVVVLLFLNIIFLFSLQRKTKTKNKLTINFQNIKKKLTKTKQK